MKSIAITDQKQVSSTSAIEVAFETESFCVMAIDINIVHTYK